MAETATLGGGCFWCLDAVYREVRGVDQVVSGFAGGHTDHPTYDQVHRTDTGHAEVVQVRFDPTIITYRQILEIFFYTHNPTTLNRQNYDIGPLYRSIILYHDQEQKAVAEEVISSFAPNLWDDPIVTELKPLDRLWPADPEQQNFFQKYPHLAYCQVIINPKLQKFRRQFESLLRTTR